MIVRTLDVVASLPSADEAQRDHLLSDDIEGSIAGACKALLSQQKQDGYWVYELEADCTIPAEYILMNHFVGELNDGVEQKISAYLRDNQNEEGGWSLYPNGKTDLSCSIKVYYALKLVGDDPSEPHMIKARQIILSLGGVAHGNVFTRITMALFAQVPWRAVPFIPAEIMLLPKWFPFHISKVSYWSRTVMVPLFILCTLKPKAVNPRKVDIEELFVTPPKEEQHYFKATTFLARFFLYLDRLGRFLERLVPRAIRYYSIQKCESWTLERMNKDHGIGGIFPAMVNAFEALVALGYKPDNPVRIQARKAIDRLLIDRVDGRMYCQPCISPVWDTCLAAQAIIEVGHNSKELDKALAWLVSRQLSDEPGDWRVSCPNLAGGGWPFQYSNDHYPDLDDTSMVAWAMCRKNKLKYAPAIARAASWVAGMQSRSGGFGSFDVDNTHYYLNFIPFADHGALLDPPTADVTARSIALLYLADRECYRTNIDQALVWLKGEQEKDGSWFGRWGTNYIYGTWSVLTALEVIGEDPKQAYIQRAVQWIIDRQNSDGGWGESNDSYISLTPKPYKSTPFQTAWALLALLAAGNVEGLSTKRGIQYLIRTQSHSGLWSDASFTAPGFPRVFYLRYHGYNYYFPLWALARYRNLLERRT